MDRRLVDRECTEWFNMGWWRNKSRAAELLFYTLRTTTFCPDQGDNLMVPERFRQIYLLNPMAALITFYRDIILYNRHPGLKLLGITSLTSLITLVIGWLIFNHYSKRFAEEI
ncbi:MAG: hypothetical protein ABIK20_05545, partial [Candidatus Omnitrophota bacterium]